jgi:Flp pilus assembly protein CpaB
MTMNSPYGNSFDNSRTFASAPEPDPRTPEKKVTRRVVSRYTRLALVAAVVLAILGFFALSSSTAPSAYVARTTNAIAAQTAMAETQFEVVAVDETFIEKGAIAGSDPEQVRAAAIDLITSGRTVVALPAGRQLHPTDFSAVPVGANGLDADERIVAVPASVVAAAGGTIRAGDRVDVFGTVRDGATTLAGVVLVDVEVVAILPGAERLESASANQSDPANLDKTTGELLPAQPIPGIYLLRVPAADVARVFSVAEGGRVYLSLRAGDADGTVPVSAEVISVLCGTAPGSPAATTVDTLDVAPPQLPAMCVGDEFDPFFAD